jgi:hypothetical protein
MKKLALLITMLLLTLSVAYAQVDLKPTVTGSAEVVWGVDLTDSGTGFTSSTSSSIALTLVSGSDTKGADADVYGTITLSGFGISFSDTATIDLSDATTFKDADGNEISADLGIFTTATADAIIIGGNTDTLRTGLTVTKPSIAAKIVLSPTMSLIIASAPAISYDKASVLNGTSVATTYSSSGGVTLNVVAAPATINVIVVSAAGCEDNAANAYAFAGDVSVTAGPATIAAYATMGVN